MDWSELVPEVLQIISKRLEKISDFVRFRTVCKAWRTAVPSCDPPAQFPWLVTLPLHLNGRTMQLHSIVSGETLTVPVPEGDRLMVGSIYGYVIFQGIFNKFLFNPLSTRKILLPRNLRSYQCQHISESNEKKELLCNRSSQLKFKKLQSGFFEPNIYNWYMNEEIDGSTDLVPQNSIKRSLIKSDAFNGITLSTETLMPSEPMTYHCMINEIVLESSGDVLQVIFKHDSLSYAITGIDVQKLDQGSTVRRFVKTHSIGDRVLFFATCNSKCWSVRSGDIPGHKGNCIYFWNLIRCDQEGDDRHEFSYELSRYNVEKDETKVLPLRTDEYYIWLMPNLC